MTTGDEYDGSDFYCDVAMPHADSALFGVVREVAQQVELRHGAAAVLTNLGGYQDSKHLHVHVHSGPRSGRPDETPSARRATGGASY
jgi:hypothetical protein